MRNGDKNGYSGIRYFKYEENASLQKPGKRLLWSIKNRDGYKSEMYGLQPLYDYIKRKTWKKYKENSKKQYINGKKVLA